MLKIIARKNNVYFPILGLIVFASCLFGAARASAATLFLLPKSGEFPIGKTFDVDVRVNSEGQGFNAAQATLQFPKDILQVKSLSSSAGASVFNFWLEDPKFSNDAGTITFIGGATNGVVGGSVPILKITFVTKGSGDATIAVTDAAVTASDGSGTNILSAIAAARFLVGPTVDIPALPAASAVNSSLNAATTTPPVIVLGPPPAPVQITRKPVEAKKLPDKPVLTVPVYPNSAAWYNFITDYLAEWLLPPDISDVATAITKDTASIPARSEGLFEAKTFPVLTDGIWYLHVRFKNNVGWGPVAHYRIALDTVPPLAFTITSSEGAPSDNPKPVFHFKTSDGLSGMQQYSIRLDDNVATTTLNDTLAPPPQAPGKHSLLVTASDQAGNSRENNFDFEVLPIASPTISFINKNVYIGEGNLLLSGTALPSSTVKLVVKTTSNTRITQASVVTDANGNWQTVFDAPFKKGTYLIEATAEDARGALSLPVKSDLVYVRERPLFTIHGFEITSFWFYIAAILFLLAGIAVGWIMSRRWLAQAGRKAIVAERDVVNAFALTRADLEKMLKNYSDKHIDEHEAAEMEFLLKKIKTRLEQVEKYIVDNIAEIPE